MEVLQLLFFAAIAVFFAVRLFTTLGKPTGHMGQDEAEDDPIRPDPKPIPQNEVEVDDNVIRPKAFSQYDPDLADVFRRIGREDRNFDPDIFLEGAKSAYRMIVEAFAEGDRDALKPLLSERVFNAYAQALEGREARGETVKTQVERIVEAKLAEAHLDGSRARIKVAFKTELATETRDNDGQRIAGDWSSLQDVSETWSFERDVASDNPNWVLAGVKTH